MKKNFYYLLLCVPLISGMMNSDAPQVQNVQFQQSGNQVIVTYDLVNTEVWQSFDVELFVSENNGYSYEGPLQKVKGDVGFDVKGGGGKRIVWEVLKERNEITGDRIKFKVEVIVDNSLKNMIFVEGGTFQMGNQFEYGNSPNEWPVHSVTLNSFYMSKYEITNAEYAAFLNAKGNQIENDTIWLEIDGFDCKIEKRGSRYTVISGYENHPIVNVSWYGARAYCNWKTEKTGKQHRLPTEAEWEYAAKGGNQSHGYQYAGSNNLDDVAWHGDNTASDEFTFTKGTKSPNELGLYDMSGNVWEWCNDWYGKSYYESSPRNNPLGPNSGFSRIIRGGSFFVNSELDCSTANRQGGRPGSRNFDLGFRIVLTFQDSNRD